MPKKIMPKLSDEEALARCQNAYSLSHQAREDAALYKIAAHNKELILDSENLWDDISLEDWYEKGWNVQQKIRYDKQQKDKLKSKKEFLWVTLNFDMKKIATPEQTLKIVKRILYHSKVTKGFAVWEWRTTEGTGLHAHIAIQGDTGKLVQYLKRQNRPSSKHTKLCKEFFTLLHHNIADDWEDYMDYLGGITKSEQKNILKQSYPALRKKFNLPNLTNNMN